MSKQTAKPDNQNTERNRTNISAPFFHRAVFIITAIAFITLAFITVRYCIKNNLQNLFAAVSITIAITLSASYWLNKLNTLRDELKNESKNVEQFKAANRKLQIEITDRKHAEDYAKMMTKKAEAANDAKSQFLANMSHEIRTPMNAIIGFSDILREENITEKQKEYVDVIRNSGGNLLNLINDILDFSKIESGKLDTETIECSLGQLLSGIESIMLPLANKKGLEFKVLQCGSLPAIIKTDPFRTRQCLINLINNAIKFTSQGHIYINVSIRFCNEKPYIDFSVEDTGIGIDPQQQKAIFKSFTQADFTTTRKYGGTGLGLTITKQLAKILGGDLSLKSKPQVGSIFTLSIPANIDIDSLPHLDKYQEACIKNAAGNEYDDIEKEDKPVKLRGSILVAEDSEPNQQLTRIFLEKMELDVTIAQNGKEAVDMALKDQFDLILMDIQMPEMNGYEATGILRDSGLTIPIIALTANALKGDSEKCIRAGCNDYIAKPVDKDKLRKTIEKYLNQSIDAGNDVSSIKSQIDELSDICNEGYSNRQAEITQDQIPYADTLMDWSKAMKYCGDETVIKRIANSILVDVRRNLELLGEYATQENFKDARIYAHKIRGTLLSIGADIVAQKAEEVEYATEKEVSGIGLMIDSLKIEFDKLAKFLEQPDWIDKAKKMNLTENKTEKGNAD